jgi:hypothetical protein
MSICEATGRAESAKTGLEGSGRDADDGEVTGALATVMAGGDLATSWNEGEGETEKDGRKGGEDRSECLLACWARRGENVGTEVV